MTEKKTRQYPTLEPECPLRPEIDKQKDQTIPNRWSQRLSGCSNLKNKKARQYPTAGARVTSEAQQTKTDNTRQLSTECLLRPETDRQNDPTPDSTQTAGCHRPETNRRKDQAIPNSWSLERLLRPKIDRQKSSDNNRQLEPRLPPEARNWSNKKKLTIHDSSSQGAP